REPEESDDDGEISDVQVEAMLERANAKPAPRELLTWPRLSRLKMGVDRAQEEFDKRLAAAGIPRR
ncbi:MAG: hypothetical protein KIS92_19685, partial [Planctomycetota bacterium]|nr:hypothetical protein [Planctomycetota bacterium]